LFLNWLKANFATALNEEMALIIAENAERIYTFFGAKGKTN